MQNTMLHAPDFGARIARFVDRHHHRRSTSLTRMDTPSSPRGTKRPHHDQDTIDIKPIKRLDKKVHPSPFCS